MLMLGAALILNFGTIARAEPLLFKCDFPASQLSFYVTIDDDGTTARIGTVPGVGAKARAYADSVTGAWVVVEFIADGRLPSALTTIKKDGVAWHSRHTMDLGGNIMPSQSSGRCAQR